MIAIRASLYRAVALVGLLTALALPATPDETHRHPADSGTADAPLCGATLPPALAGRVVLETAEVTGQLASGAACSEISQRILG